MIAKKTGLTREQLYQRGKTLIVTHGGEGFGKEVIQGFARF